MTMLKPNTKYQMVKPLRIDKIGHINGDCHPYRFGMVFTTDDRGRFVFRSDGLISEWCGDWAEWEEVDESEPATKLAIADSNPPHYTNGIQYIEYTRSYMDPAQFQGAMEWNTGKYLRRWRTKGKPLEDLCKARDYLNWLIESVEKEGMA